LSQLLEVGNCPQLLLKWVSLQVFHPSRWFPYADYFLRRWCLLGNKVWQLGKSASDKVLLCYFWAVCFNSPKSYQWMSVYSMHLCLWQIWSLKEKSNTVRFLGETVLGFALRPSHRLGRCSPLDPWPLPPFFFCFSYF
jgi:hypothetical protein